MDYSGCYEIFGRLMEDGEACRNPSLTFDRVCMLLGVSPDKFGRYVFAQVGMTGEDIVNVYKRDSRARGTGVR